MPTATFYPTSVTSAVSGFTAAQLANVLGNTTTYAVHTAAVVVNGGIGGTFAFDLSTLPSNIIINTITFTLIAKASRASRRSAYQVDLYGAGGGTVIKNISVPLLTTDTTATVVMTGTDLTNMGWTIDEIKAASNEWSGTFISTNATSTTTSWQKFIMAIDYTLVNTVNTLFFGETF